MKKTGVECPAMISRALIQSVLPLFTQCRYHSDLSHLLSSSLLPTGDITYLHVPWLSIHHPPLLISPYPSASCRNTIHRKNRSSWRWPVMHGLHDLMNFFCLTPTPLLFLVMHASLLYPISAFNQDVTAVTVYIAMRLRKNATGLA